MRLSTRERLNTFEELAASCKVEPLRRPKNEVLEYSKILGVEPWIPHVGKEIPAIAELPKAGFEKQEVFRYAWLRAWTPVVRLQPGFKLTYTELNPGYQFVECSETGVPLE